MFFWYNDDPQGAEVNLRGTFLAQGVICPKTRKNFNQGECFWLCYSIGVLSHVIVVSDFPNTNLI